ncbi:IS3 family transposase [Gilliamella apicola]|uniref:HTH-like domain-containing protein n=1 Tax=Gilliamella apicola TaxID=1196095 RepID=A0A2V4EHP4_9GAMM|nr:hypothetical protein DKK79_07315 [Gilliamella apicola]
MRRQVIVIFADSRGSTGSWMITATLHQKDITEGRFKVRQLMKKAELCSNQPGVHSYKITTTERSDIPNKLARDLK